MKIQINISEKFIHTGLLMLACLMVFSLQSCSYDNEEDLFKDVIQGCDTSSVTYSATIAPIIDQHCNACHKEGSNIIITDNYDDLSMIAADGRLWGVVNHENGYSPMPQNAAKLTGCELQKIKKWLDNGYPEN